MPRREHRDPIDRHAGAQLRELRLARGWTQAELAKAFKVTYQQIQKYESGDNRLTASYIALAARTFGVPVTHFFPDPTEDPCAAPAEMDPATRRVLDLMRHVRCLERGQFDSIFNVVKKTAEANAALALGRDKGGLAAGRYITEPRPGGVIP